MSCISAHANFSPCVWILLLLDSITWNTYEQICVKIIKALNVNGCTIIQSHMYHQLKKSNNVRISFGSMSVNGTNDPWEIIESWFCDSCCFSFYLPCTTICCCKWISIIILVWMKIMFKGDVLHLLIGHLITSTPMFHIEIFQIRQCSLYWILGGK